MDKIIIQVMPDDRQQVFIDKLHSPLNGADHNKLKTTAQWFKEAVPYPSRQNVQAQFGTHFEEVGEMVAAIQVTNDASAIKRAYYRAKFWLLGKLLDSVGMNMKKTQMQIAVVDAVGLVDALADQHVTSVGCGHMVGFDMDYAICEVDASNFSKFVDGKAIFDKNMKIAKGPQYRKAFLLPAIGPELGKEM